MRREPFVITDENRDDWRGVSGVRARGIIVDRRGRFLPNNERGARADSFGVLSMLVRSAKAAEAEAIALLAHDRIRRACRNRPRVRAIWPEYFTACAEAAS